MTSRQQGENNYMQQLDWIKCDGKRWCNFENLNLDHNHFDNLKGVYMIWHGAPMPSVVRVGQGVIRDRIASHKKDPQILKYSDKNLYVTWAKVNEEKRDGIERFLAENWTPLVGNKFPEAEKIEVNSPW